MMTYETEQIKNIMCTFAYQQAHKRINQVVEKPTKINDRIIYDDNFGFGDLLDALFITTSSIPLETEDSCQDYNRMVDNILQKVFESTYGDIQVVFHFGLLIDYQHLFTKEEHSRWVIRMNSLFNGFCPSLLTSLKQYLNAYFGETEFEEEMYREEYFWKSSYTFVFSDNSEIHEPYTFDSKFWNTLADFAEDYYAFYKDLTAEITKRKRG